MAGAGRAAAPGSPGSVPAAEVDEVRIVAGWIARNEPPMIEIGEPAEAAEWALREAGVGAVLIHNG